MNGPPEIGDVLAGDVDEAGSQGLLLAAGPLERVHTLGSEIEAHVLTDALQAEGIQAVVQNYGELAFNAVFVPQRGWGCILTRVEDSDRAKEIITATFATLPDDEPTGE